ncbi:TPA: phage tail protein [Escherichia coli]|nr:phage tail protein [Escherichia coli]
MSETKNIDTETLNNTVADDVTAGEDMVVERGVKLTRPIERGGEKITYVEITGAIEQAGSLRGLSLTDVLNLKTDTMFTLLPRVTSPRLDEVTLKKMLSRDFIQLCGAAVNFMSDPDSGAKSGQGTAA